jgi:acyl-CoA synthetase (AMP-forming)/AMP-acid ligase II
MKGLDLSKWRVAFNGAEPVRASTLEAFSRKFEQVGFRHSSHLPTYGMAETTLIVTAGPHADIPMIRHYDGRNLAARVVLPVEPNATDSRALVGCGQTSPNERVEIVDTETFSILPDDQIGEIWIQSPSAGTGYWEKPEITEKTFNAMTADGQGPFLRTGDLGFFDNGELFVTGRLKDLIIVRGRNHYPQDIEWVVGDLEGVRRGNVVAFSVMKDGLEALVIAAEGNSGDAARLKTDIARVVSETFGLTPAHVAICPVGALPKTSSGKAQRRKSKAMWESKELEEHP